MGIVASQIILDKPRSIGDMVIASRNSAKNARANISIIPAETRIASKMTGICGSAEISNGHTELSIHDDFKIESDSLH